jgi:hypothetical protein
LCRSYDYDLASINTGQVKEKLSFTFFFWYWNVELGVNATACEGYVISRL